MVANVLTARRKLWPLRADDIDHCRIRFSWRSIHSESAQEAIGVWFDPPGAKLTLEKTLHEGSPHYGIPFFIVANETLCRTHQGALNLGRVYLASWPFLESPLPGVFNIPEMLDGTYFFSLELLSGDERRSLAGFVLSVSAAVLKIEPLMTSANSVEVAPAVLRWSVSRAS